MKAPLRTLAVFSLLTLGAGWAFMPQTATHASEEVEKEAPQSATSTDTSNDTPSEESAIDDAAASESNMDFFAKGEEYFLETCAECHGSEGGGGIGVPLRENTQYTKYVVRAIVNGQGRMPPVAADFDAHKIAAILTYISNSWGNDYGDVTEEDVEEFLAN